MSYVRVKPGAGFPVLAPAGIRILGALEGIARHWEHVLTVTSGSESRGRDPLDPHMTGEAVDVSVSGLEDERVRFIRDLLMIQLGEDFTVLFEVPMSYHGALDVIAYRSRSATAPHFHIQRKKGTTWPNVKLT